MSLSHRGKLRPFDAGKAADELFVLWQGFSNFQLALDVDVEAIARDLPAQIDRGIATFLAAHGRDLSSPSRCGRKGLR